MDCSLPGSSVHATVQARLLEWVAISSSRGSFRPRNRPASPAMAGGFFTTSITWKFYVGIDCSPIFIKIFASLLSISCFLKVHPMPFWLLIFAWSLVPTNLSGFKLFSLFQYSEISLLCVLLYFITHCAEHLVGSDLEPFIHSGEG